MSPSSRVLASNFKSDTWAWLQGTVEIQRLSLISRKWMALVWVNKGQTFRPIQCASDCRKSSTFLETAKFSGKLNYVCNTIKKMISELSIVCRSGEAKALKSERWKNKALNSVTYSIWPASWGLHAVRLFWEITIVPSLWIKHLHEFIVCSGLCASVFKELSG